MQNPLLLSRILIPLRLKVYKTNFIASLLASPLIIKVAKRQLQKG